MGCRKKTVDDGFRKNSKNMSSQDFTKLKRSRNPLPDFVRHALHERNLMDAFQARPAYQQNDYIGWILGAKRLETVQKRLNQMLSELEMGGVYMKMKHPPSA
jgi:uncharacterized protein YdeI (YjbR/CyaY-like superfamily)